jgi:transposase
MNVHQNARLTPWRRRELVRQLAHGERLRRVAEQFGISARTARKWWGRFRAEGAAGLADRSSRPHRSPRQTAPAVALGIKVLRRQHWTCTEIGQAVGVSAATAARVLRPLGLSRRGRCEAPPSVRRYEHRQAGRPAAFGHQETRPHRGRRAPHHRPCESVAPQPWPRLAVPARRDR